MKKLLVKWIIAAAAIYAAGYVLDGFNVSTATAAFSAAFLFGILNFSVKPILKILTFPVTLMSFGLFLFVINGIMVLIVSELLPGIHADNFLSAMLASIVISIVTMVSNTLTGVNDKK